MRCSWCHELLFAGKYHKHEISFYVVAGGVSLPVIHLYVTLERRLITIIETI